MSTEVIIITSTLSIPLAEVQFRFVRSSGPGGQHVNKTSTQVELLFDVARSPSLTETQRQRILHKLKNTIDQDGLLHLNEQSERSQYQNKQQAIEKFRLLMIAAVRIPKPRLATRPTKASKEKRITGKKKRGAVKRLRKYQPDE
jgi:ribosome-associated protein